MRKINLNSMYLAATTYSYTFISVDENQNLTLSTSEFT